MKDLTFANLHGRNSRNPCLSNTFALIINASLKTFSIFFFSWQIHMFQNKFSRKKGLNSISTTFPGYLCCKLTLVHLTFISSSIYHTLYLHMLKTAENLKLKKITSTPTTTVACFNFQLSTSPVTDTSNSTLLTIKETYLIPFLKLYTQLPVKAMFCHFFTANLHQLTLYTSNHKQ